MEKAMFGMGCFWHVEDTFMKTPGVTKTLVGYTGGRTKKPTYKEVCGDDTGHAEVVYLEFDPQKISYEKLLHIFWEDHDPTTLNRQGPDEGSQYRSAIYYFNDEQKQKAEASKAELTSAKKFSRPIVTEITEAPEFYRAEEYHQKYFQKNGLSGCPI
jgi:peptide-methionine (S)-S-oxide reductase